MTNNKLHLTIHNRNKIKNNRKIANAIAIGGMVCAGKSTITSKIAKKYKFIPIFELNDDKKDLTNILLNYMYQRKPIANAVCQLHFLLSRFDIYKDNITIKGNKKTLVFDRTIFEDRLFAFHNMLNEPSVFEYYEKLWCDKIDELIHKVGAPKLYIILEINWKTFTKRLHIRNRLMETENFKKNQKYFKSLNKCYVNYLTSICKIYYIPYIKINVDNKNIDQIMKIIDKEFIKQKII